MAKPTPDEQSACEGPSYDAAGALSPECRACGKCDAVARLMRELAPIARGNKETLRPAAHAAR